MIRPTRISFGGTAGIVTSMALLAGLQAAHAGTQTLVAALLIAALADNLTDSLSVHMYQESERMDRKAAFLGTVVNFATRLLVCLSFVLIAMVLSPPRAAVAGFLWGMSLLTALTWLIARDRNLGVLSEVAKHLAVALVIIAVSRGVGQWITLHIDTLLAIGRGVPAS